MAHFIVLGNEKGGSGKSTTAVHLAIALCRAGFAVGTVDLDLRQRSFHRYLENRAEHAARTGAALPMPERESLAESTLDSQSAARAEEEGRFADAIAVLERTCRFILIDCPGAHSRYAQMAHAIADTLITPMNDSLIDFDLLARVEPSTGKVLGPSIYSEAVWKARQLRAAAGLAPLDWVVLRNRIATLHARNKRRVGSALANLSERIGFRIVPGFSERVIFREMFLSGLTLLDLREVDGLRLSLSNIAARQEMRDLMTALALPEVEVAF
ncbi:MAG: division plane positioning ATPase MipZ [Pseudomonadota bacterium]